MLAQRDKILLGIALVGALVLCAGYIVDALTPGERTGEYIASCGEGIAELATLTLLLYNSTLMTTWYWKALLLSGAVVVMGAAMVILRLSYAFETWLLGVILIELFYTIRFVSKNPTAVLDWFKYSWICARCFFSSLVFFGILAKEYELIPLGVFWATFVLFVLTKLKLVGEGKGNY